MYIFGNIVYKRSIFFWASHVLYVWYFRQEEEGKLFRNSRERLGQLFAPKRCRYCCQPAAAISAYTHTPGFRVKVRQQRRRRRGKKFGKWGARYIISPPQNGGRKLTNKDFLEGLSISPLDVRHWNSNNSRKKNFELGTGVDITRTNQRKKAGYYV